MTNPHEHLTVRVSMAIAFMAASWACGLVTGYGLFLLKRMLGL